LLYSGTFPTVSISITSYKAEWACKRVELANPKISLKCVPVVAR